MTQAPLVGTSEIIPSIPIAFMADLIARFTVLVLLIWGQAASAQTPDAQGSAPTAAALARQVLSTLETRQAEQFSQIYPDADGEQLVNWADEYDWPLVGAAAEVVRADSNRALLYLAGYPRMGNAGQESALGRLFTGLYEAARGPDGWRLVRRVGIEMDNEIDAQTLTVMLQPGEGLHVRDTLDISVNDPGGFWVYLNRAIRIDSVSVAGAALPYRFDAGLLWVHLPVGRHRLCLVYGLERSREGAENGNFSHFGETFGHVRDQHYWHPGFSTGVAAGLADFTLTLSAPVDVQVVTSVVQAETVVEAKRWIHARSERPLSGLSLFYDRDWQSTHRPLGSFQAGLYFGEGFEPERSEIEAMLERIHRVLSTRFGEPSGRNVALVQVRGASSYGWHFRSGNVIGAGERGGALVQVGAAPSHYLGHEVAHNWTNPTGTGALSLSEGWATFAEALVLADEFGPEVERAFWERQRMRYMLGGYDGQVSLLGDTHNGGVSYAKGAWVLRMLRDAVGEEAFNAGMRAYVSLPLNTPATVEAFIHAMSAAAGFDVEPFLRPWLEESALPDLDARLDGQRLVITQQGRVYPLTLEMDLVTPNGPLRRTHRITARETVLDLDGLLATDVLVDPDHRLLLRRHRGDVVRFVLEAPEAQEVFLVGVTPKQLPAVFVGGQWVVEVALTEGRYAYSWRVDGAYRAPNEEEGRVVYPRVRFGAAQAR